VDERVRELVVDEEISIGDYVLSGGEIPAMVVIDAACRLVPGVMGSRSSLSDESHTAGLLEYPQYTRPEEFRGLRVPEVLLSGHHERVARWRQAQALHRSLVRRPDLLRPEQLSAADRQLLEEHGLGEPGSGACGTMQGCAE
jgi:tRNA (guanine37-N1)-methyltransferase